MSNTVALCMSILTIKECSILPDCDKRIRTLMETLQPLFKNLRDLYNDMCIVGDVRVNAMALLHCCLEMKLLTSKVGNANIQMIHKHL